MSQEYHRRLARIQAEHPRAYERWTAEEDRTLLEYHRSEWSVDELAAHFQRQTSAIRARLKKLTTTGTETMTNPSQEETSRTIRHYFVDEAGDGVLFSDKGKILIGTEGCSNYFILGFVDIVFPDKLASELADLRLRLLADPYFKDIPSMQSERKKTALLFHAKDDIPEVRREVFALIHRHLENLRFFAVVRDKRQVLAYVRQRNEREKDYRYNPNELYDFLVRRLFPNVLHKDDEYRICFARRGKSDRTESLREALETARGRFADRWGKTSSATIHVIPTSSEEEAGLQVADYFLWALQRLYEKGEDRYVDYLRPAIRYVHDIDDTRDALYGVYYTRKKALTKAALEGRIY